jgi:protein transport protein DSL1/ZW10
VSTVRDLFQQEGRDMTFIYCPNWLKFQYLAEIMDSSLIDIKYLWSEGELSLEFAADEVEGLIEALFAESQMRRQAIQEIRRGGRR